MKNLIFIGLISFLSCQQNPEVLKEKITTNLVEEKIEEEHRATNLIDTKGRQGYWIIYGRDMPDKKEFPADGKIEEGNYLDNKKTGEWIFYKTDGMSVESTSNFRNDTLNGLTRIYDHIKEVQREINYDMGKVLSDTTMKIVTSV